MPVYTVYVVVSSEGYRYTGFTSDLLKRLDQHNSGVSRWTRRGTNWQLVYTEEYSDKAQAIKRERWLKSGHGRQFLDTLLKGS